MSTSVYRGAACPVCHGEGRIDHCDACGGNGTLPCDLCEGRGYRLGKGEGDGIMVPCVCQNGYFTCAACSGGTGACGQCAGTGILGG